MTDNPEGPQTKGSTQKATNLKPAKTSRSAQLRKLLMRKNGATIAQIQKTFGWQPHTVRAAISGLRKAGEMVERSEAAKGAVYRIVSAGVAS